MLGIGGIGMSALARYFNAMGKTVAGYDKTPTPLTNELIAEKIAVHFEDDMKLLPEFIENENPAHFLIIYTPAIPNDHGEFNYLASKFQLYKRSEILGLITENSNTIAVAGTHGKTTTSSIVTHLLKSSGRNCSAFLGGIAKNYNSNFLLGAVQKEDHVTIVEADEFDRSFLTLHPHAAIITSMDADHLDIYGDLQTLVDCYRQFAEQVDKKGLLILKKGLAVKPGEVKILDYSITESASATAKNIRIENRQYVFDYVSPSHTITGLQLGLPGRHNVENAVAAVTVALHYRLSADEIKRGLSTYSGVKRRFDYQLKNEDLVYIDDYAHHPQELSAAINSVKELYPDKKITVVFQPHLFTRTRDFADEFAASLSLPDETILLPIYPARELPIEGVDSEMILGKITTQKILCNKSDLLSILKNKKLEVLLTLGAGDIDQLVQSIQQMLSGKVNENSN